MEPSEPDPLLDLAAAVADGAPVDWLTAQSSVGSSEDVEVVRGLQIVAAIAALHRQAVSGASPVGEFAASPLGPAVPRPPQDGEGRRWGPLRVLEERGSGTFGQVFRAWDTTLDREVALKLLKRRRRGGADSIVREGQLLARVRHPNVMAVYGALEVDGEIGIWGEFLRGRTLAQIVNDDGPLSADEAVVVGEAICRALAAAHRADLLHRDVKAQNVIREKGGRIVLMDFGLGRERNRELAEGAAELAGTPLYLAPEILDGGRASVQSDIYSLGVLMFFLVTGRFPVTGKSLDEIAAAHKEGRRQRLHDLRPELPATFIQTVQRALDPDPAARFESAGAMQAALTVVNRSTVPTADSRLTRRALIAAGVALVVLAAATAILGWLLLARPAPADSSVLRLAIEPPPGTRFSDTSRNMPAISPDGKTVAFSARDNSTGRIDLWLHSLETGESRKLPDSHRGLAAFWSPDSKALGFFEPAGAIKLVTPAGVSIGSIETAQEPRGATWSARGMVLFTKGQRSGLYAVAAPGGAAAATLVLAPDAGRGELAYMWPQFLSDGDHFIYFTLSNDKTVRGIYLASLTNRSARLLTNSDASGFISGDTLLFVQGGNLVGQTFSLSERRLIGSPQTIVEGVASNYDWRTVATASADGRLAYVPAQETTELAWINRDGVQEGTLNVSPARYRSPALSRDGTLLAVQRYGDGGLSVIDIIDATAANREASKTLWSVAYGAEVQFPVWGPGHRLAYASTESGKSQMYIKDFDRDEVPRVLSTRTGAGGADDGEKMPTDWSPDGEHLLFVDFATDRPYNVQVLPLTPGSQPFSLRPGEGYQYEGHVAPDGRSAIYTRRTKPLREGEPPERELWMCDFPTGQNPRFLASGGIDAAWPSNEWLSFFDRTGPLNLFRVPRSGASAGTMAKFATGVDTPEASRNNYSWAPDGRRLLVVRPVHEPQQLRVFVLLNAVHRPVERRTVASRP